jgi:hypothetical protein
MNPFPGATVNSWLPSSSVTQMPTMPTFPNFQNSQQQPQPVQYQRGIVNCPGCAQELAVNTTICWRCSSQNISNQFTDPVQPVIPQASPSILAVPVAAAHGPYSQQTPHNQLFLMQQLLQYQEQQRALQQALPALPSQPSFVLKGGSASNPLTINDSPPLQKTIQQLPTPPGAWPMTSLPPLLAQQLFRLQNHTSQTGYPNPLIQPGAVPNYPTYDYHFGNPSSEEIKELLANIRPDEEIETDDKDAIVPGLAKNMRLMKHQQVSSPVSSTFNDRWGWHGCKRWRTG